MLVCAPELTTVLVERICGISERSSSPFSAEENRDEDDHALAPRCGKYQVISFRYLHCDSAHSFDWGSSI